MQFLYPAFLFGLLALAVPVIVHLFYFRKFKTIYFTNVRFLKELKQETSARQKLKNLLVLLMRALAIAAMVFAFAQPFIPKGNVIKHGLKSVSIFIDNSYSMNATDKDLSLFEKAKFKAKELINGYKEEDNFQVLTNDFEGKHQRLMSKEDALAAIEELRPSPAVRNISDIMKRQQQVLNTSERSLKIAYILSDFQKNISDFVKDPATKTGDQLILRNLNFIGGRHVLMSYSLPLLTDLLQTMRDHPQLKIEVQGHICCERNGGDGYDYDTGTRDLSVQRAKFVCDYLIQNGIDPARLSYRGFGSSRKLYTDEINAEQQAANRRVEIKILNK